MSTVEHRSDDHNYGGRDEYCVDIAADHEAFETALTIEKLEDLLYANHGVTNDTYFCEVNSGEQTIRRAFSCLNGATRAWQLTWPLIETSIDITYIFNKKLQRERYLIAAAWMVHRPELTTSPMVTKYCIDKYPSGPLQAFTEQYSYEDNGLVGRKMTPYDFSVLYTDLDRISDLHRAELMDNDRTRLIV